MLINHRKLLGFGEIKKRHISSELPLPVDTVLRVMATDFIPSFVLRPEGPALFLFQVEDANRNSI
jgi:hypothetical protein